MATLLLRAAGTFVGGLIGGPFGAILGAAGSLAGFAIDNALLSKSETRQGPRLEGMPVLNASEGGAIPRVYGYARAGGQIIWATRFREEQSTEKVGGGKGIVGGSRVETFSYFGNFAVAVCEGPIAGIRRVWADGQELDVTDIEMRVYTGTQTQLPDPLIEANQGQGKAPAYRGMAYVVFEGLPLEAFGNRIPQLSFEVMRPIGKLEPQVEAITIIPGASEYAYAPYEVRDEVGPGNTTSLNRHVLHAATDWEASINELQALCPNLRRVALVVSWFGTDLRAGHCIVEPRVEVQSRPGASDPWVVSGIERENAQLVSQINDRPAFGGTPSDASVLAAIADLKGRGLEVTLYPFLMMDIPVGNGLPDPYGRTEQAVYPWRGRITDGSDQTAAIHGAVASFAGSVSSSAFTALGETISCASTELSYRRLVLHYAHLCVLAGGVDAFIIGSELRGLTQLRDHNDAFPFVDHLISLGADCRTILGVGTDITYAADWSEYFGFQPADGSGDVFFNLDPLWSHSAITAIGIDNYMPLADWRGTSEGAQQDDARSAFDADIMGRTVNAGEGFDWYYASAADRDAGVRTPIASGDQGDDWLYRYKDLEGWWNHQHFDRRGGVAVAQSSAWVPQSKPIWFTELGAPAVDAAANQPNVFPDPKSSENAAPYQSRGGRDDLAQRRFLEAHLGYWAGQNNAMVPTDRIYLWTWDARPQPAFPAQTDVWSDGSNWHLGHWLTGRLGGVPADDVLHAIASDYGLAGIDTSKADGVIDGLLLDGDQTARSVIEALSDLWNLTATQEGECLIISSFDWRAAAADIRHDDLVEVADDPITTLERLDDSELPGRLDFAFADVFSSYEAASVSAFRGYVGLGTENVSLSISLSEGVAKSYAADLLRSRWASRDSVSFVLPPAWESLQAGAPISINSREYAVSDIERGDAISVSARSVDRLSTRPPVQDLPEVMAAPLAASAGAPDVNFLDLPHLPGTDSTVFASVSIRQWRGAYALYSSPADDGFRRRGIASRNGISGRLIEALSPGVAWRWNKGQVISVELVQGELSSQSSTSVFAGANALAVETALGWEVVQFADATLTGFGRYELSGLLRGQNGTERQMALGAVSGARIVVLNEALVPLSIDPFERGIELNWRTVRAGDLLSSSETVASEFASGVRSLCPLSPVHLRRRGHLFSWTRRDRLDADNWDQVDVPMSERDEAYAVRLVDADTELTVHEETVAAPKLDATSITPLPSSVRLEVAQISAISGPGDPASRIFAN